MTKCEDCGLINPPDTHTCQEYEQRVRHERNMLTTEQLLLEFEARITELERRVAALSIQANGAAPWRLQ